MGHVQHIVRGIGINRELGNRLLYAIDNGAKDVAGDGKVVVGLGAHADKHSLVFGRDDQCVGVVEGLAEGGGGESAFAKAVCYKLRCC